jgi:hypothetical protein
MAREVREYDRLRRGSISQVASFANWSIRAVTAAIALVFAGLALKDIPFAAISNTNPEYFQAFILSVYVWCWAFGTTMDTNLQGAVYLVDPEGGRIRMGSIVAVAGLAIVAIGLLLVRHNELYFSLAMLSFTITDVLTWLYLRYRFLPPIVEATRKKYEAEDDYYGQILLKTVVAQVSGDWKWWRQVVLFAIVVMMIVVALSPRLKEFVSVEIHSAISAIALESMNPLLEDFLLLLFVLVSEIWHFAVRLQTLLSIRLLNGMEKEYEIKPLPKSA